MKQYPTETYGIPFFLKVPATYEEYAEVHGDANAALNNAVDHDVAHTILSKVRAKLAEVLVSKGYPFDKTTNAKGETVDVKPDKKWFAAAIAALGLSAPECSQIVQSIADELGYDVSSSRGLNGGPSKKDLSDAESLIAAIDAGQSTYDRIKANLEARNPGLVIETDADSGQFTAEALAKGLAYERRRIEAERKANQNALL